MRHIVWLAFLIIALKAEAQTLSDPIYVSYSAMPQNSLKGAQGELAMNYLETQAAAPIINLGERTRFINMLYYRYSTFQLSPGASRDTLSFSRSLHDLRYSAILRHTITERVEMVGVARLLLRSDLEQRLTAKDFFPFGLLLATYAVKGNPNFRIGLGVALNNDFSYNAIVPVVTFRYEGEKLWVEAIYPNIHVLYKKSDAFQFGLFANFDGNISRIDQNRLAVEAPAARFQKNFQILVAPTVSHRLYKQFFAHLKVGIAPTGNFRLLDGSYDQIEAHAQEFEPYFFVRTGVSLRIKS